MNRSASSDSLAKRIANRHLEVSRSTFKGGLGTPVHRWFRLTPSFGPELVEYVLSRTPAPPNPLVFDPFCGAGTTIIECKLRRIPSFGFEINPFLHFVGKTSVNWQLPPADGRRNLSRILKRFDQDRAKFENLSISETGLPIPQIHDVNRWWRKDVLKDLLILKCAISEEATRLYWADFFRLALAAVLVPHLTNVTLGRLQLHFVDRSKDSIDTRAIFLSHCETMLANLPDLTSRSDVRTDIFYTDATNPRIKRDLKADIVITSPPYPNRYSYVWNTRPHLFMLDMFKDSSQAGKLDRRTIGGTWGSATSDLRQSQIKATYPAVENAATPVVEKIRAKNNLMANYVMKYFNLLAQQILAMNDHLNEKVQVAYVVGNSCVSGEYVETDLLLAQIFEELNLGYHVDSIERFRKRHSGKDLFESIIFASRKSLR